MAPLTTQLAAFWHRSARTVLAAVPDRGCAEDALVFRRASTELRRLAWGLHREAILAGRSPRVAGELADLLLGVDVIEEAVHALAVTPGGVRYDRSIRSLADCLRAHAVPCRDAFPEPAAWSAVAFIGALSRMATHSPDSATILRLADRGLERPAPTAGPAVAWRVVASCAQRLATHPPPSPQIRELAGGPGLPRLLVGAPGTLDGNVVAALDDAPQLLPDHPPSLALIELPGGE